MYKLDEKVGEWNYYNEDGLLLTTHYYWPFLVIGQSIQLCTEIGKIANWIYTYVYKWTAIMNLVSSLRETCNVGWWELRYGQWPAIGGTVCTSGGTAVQCTPSGWPVLILSSAFRYWLYSRSVHEVNWQKVIRNMIQRICSLFGCRTIVRHQTHYASGILKEEYTTVRGIKQGTY